MKNGKLIFGIFVAVFFILTYFMTAASDAILGIRVIDIADIRVLSLVPVKNIVGVTISAVVILYFWKGKNGFYLKQLDLALIEIQKVSFPTKEETKATTISVFIFVGIMLVIFVIFDFLWSSLSSLIY